MASLGDLVVTLTANSANFNRNIAKARGTVGGFVASTTSGMGRVVTAAAAAAAAIGAISVGRKIIGLAMDAETLAVKFRVLLKSGTAANKMLAEIGEFAASTPFQKMDIANAAQKLLAFNVPAKDVMGTLQDIGDISALTGNSILEMAELYGKANVQGRLFMEDINQLTGRGIPIIQELAKQFGVTEGAVRGLVSSGKVSADNITQAFAAMTGAGGQFEGGMKQLSETAAGKLSTLKDNVTELATELGTRLLPTVKRTLEFFLTSIDSMKERFGGFTGVVDAGLTFVSDGFGWLQTQIAKGITTAMVVGEYAFENWQSIGLLALKSVGLGAVKMFGIITHFFMTQIPAYLTWFGDNWQNIFSTSFSFVSSGFMNLAKNIRNIWSAVLDYITGASESLSVTWTPLLDGFKNTVKELPDIPDRAVGQLEAEMQADVTRMAAGLAVGFSDKLNDRLSAIDALSQNTGAAKPTAPEIEKVDAVTGNTGGGNNAVASSTPKHSGVLQKGSADAFKAILQGGRGNKELKEQQKQTKVQEKIAKGIEKLVTAPNAMKIQGAI